MHQAKVRVRSDGLAGAGGAAGAKVPSAMPAIVGVQLYSGFVRRVSFLFFRRTEKTLTQKLHIGRKFRCALERLRCASLGNVVVVCALERLAPWLSLSTADRAEHLNLHRKTETCWSKFSLICRVVGAQTADQAGPICQMLTIIGALEFLAPKCAAAAGSHVSAPAAALAGPGPCQLLRPRRSGGWANLQLLKASCGSHAPPPTAS